MYYYGSDIVNLFSTYNKQVPEKNLNYTVIYELEYYKILELLYSSQLNYGGGWTFMQGTSDLDI
jgi:hypothetical protein